MTTEKIPAPGDEKYDKTKFKEEEKLDRHTLKNQEIENNKSPCSFPFLYEQTYFLPFLRLSYKYLHFFTEWWDDEQDQCNGQKCVFDSSFIIPLIMIL